MIIAVHHLLLNGQRSAYLLDGQDISTDTVDCPPGKADLMIAHLELVMVLMLVQECDTQQDILIPPLITRRTSSPYQLIH